MRYPIIVVDFPEKVEGYWDGGKKSHFEFSPSPKVHKSGTEIQWTSLAANAWIITPSGKNWNDATGYAVAKLNRMMQVPNAKITIKQK